MLTGPYETAKLLRCSTALLKSHTGSSKSSQAAAMIENSPPLKIDGACVLEWAWSGQKPFGRVPGAEPPEIYGLAIATYDFEQFYRFSCDKDWNTTQDKLYDSIEEAKRMLPNQYKEVPAVWHAIDQGQ